MLFANILTSSVDHLWPCDSLLYCAVGVSMNCSSEVSIALYYLFLLNDVTAIFPIGGNKASFKMQIKTNAVWVLFQGLLRCEGTISVDCGNVRYKYTLHVYIVCLLHSPGPVRGMCIIWEGIAWINRIAWVKIEQGKWLHWLSLMWYLSKSLP